jgi:hypothetical protein
MSAVRLVVVLAALVAAAACGGSSTSGTVGQEGCPAEAHAVFWGGTQWVELGQGLADDVSECIEYFVTVPPQDNDRTALREAAAFEEVRALDPRIHPAAEIRFTGETGWREWAIEEERTFYVAGVEARRRMEEAGLDVGKGETWALNELSPEVLDDAPGWREDVLEFMRGLYDGGPGMSKARGIVFNIFVPSETSDLTAYKASLQAWLEDEDFWIKLDKYVDFFAEEVYPSPLTWAWRILRSKSGPSISTTTSSTCSRLPVRARSPSRRRARSSTARSYRWRMPRGLTKGSARRTPFPPRRWLRSSRRRYTRFEATRTMRGSGLPGRRTKRSRATRIAEET